MPVVDLFAPEEPSHTFLGRRPRTDDEPDKVRLQAGLTEEQGLKIIIMYSRQDEKLWQACKLERVRVWAPPDILLPLRRPLSRLRVSRLCQSPVFSHLGMFFTPVLYILFVCIEYNATSFQ